MGEGPGKVVTADPPLARFGQQILDWQFDHPQRPDENPLRFNRPLLDIMFFLLASFMMVSIQMSAAAPPLSAARSSTDARAPPPTEQFLQGGLVWRVTSNGDYAESGGTDTVITLALRSQRRV
jgi:hypothetical protein